MSSIVANASRSVPVRDLDNIRPASAKAGLRSDQIGLAFSAVVKRAVLRHYGSVKEAAYALGEVDPSLMMREFDACKFSRFDEHADVIAKAAVAHALQEEFGVCSTPQQRARQMIRAARRALDDIDQVLEQIA